MIFHKNTQSLLLRGIMWMLKNWLKLETRPSMYKCIFNLLKRSLVSRCKGSNPFQKNFLSCFLSLSPTSPFGDLAGHDILHCSWRKVWNCPPFMVCSLMTNQRVIHVISRRFYTCNSNYVQTLSLLEITYCMDTSSSHLKKHMFVGALVIQIVICSSNSTTFSRSLQ